jgi:hypothetical protein
MLVQEWETVREKRNSHLLIQCKFTSRFRCGNEKRDDKKCENLHLAFFHRIELEKTLQQCINEKDECKEKYEECNR